MIFWREKLRSLFKPIRHTIRITNLQREIQVRQGSMLLDALLKRGADYPHLCKLGDCTRCKSVLVTGRVLVTSNEPHALTEQEKAQGIFLACRATPLSDCELQAFGKDGSGHAGNGEVIALK